MEQQSADKYAEESESNEHDGIQFHPPNCPKSIVAGMILLFGPNMNFLTPSSKHKSNDNKGIKDTSITEGVTPSHATNCRSFISAV